LVIIFGFLFLYFGVMELLHRGHFANAFTGPQKHFNRSLLLVVLVVWVVSLL